MSKIRYEPPPTINDFIKDYKEGELFYCWITGPIGSGKTTANFFKLVHHAGLQAKSPDGLRHSRAVIVRNTMPQLKDTTLSSWGYWFRDGQAGHWNATDKIFTLRYGDVECEVLFRPLDTPEDAARVLSLEINFAIIDEFVEIPRKIIDDLSGRPGRYKAPDWASPTIWGMWGASNPSTEDNWWFDHLHGNLAENARYFSQPSGLSDEAENLENLPGGRAYYTNAMKGKSEAWIRQFVHAEWGYSIDGEAVAASFKAALHVSKTPLLYNPSLRLIIGLDPGLSGSAFVFMQQTLDGRLNVLGELVQRGLGAKRMIEERLNPYLRQRFPGAKPLIVPDPAANNRSSNDERTIVATFKEKFEVSIETNNRLPLRLNAIDHYASKLIGGVPALQVDARECPTLIRALGGGWRWTVDKKKDILKGAEPEDNPYTHVGDAFGYGCRYYHRGALRDERMSASGRPPFVPPRVFSPNYHVQ